MVNQVINEDFYSGLIAKFINYDENKRRSNFETHEDYSGCIYSTIFQPVAAGYGDRVSVIEEKNIMSLDLNFFNFINNWKWLADQDLQPFEQSTLIGDAGRFLTASYIPSKDLVAYQIRQSLNSGDWNDRNPEIRN